MTLTQRGAFLRGAQAVSCCTGRCLPVAVVVVVLLVVEAAVFEGLVPFLVPVTNSIYETHRISKHSFNSWDALMRQWLSATTIYSCRSLLELYWRIWGVWCSRALRYNLWSEGKRVTHSPHLVSFMTPESCSCYINSCIAQNYISQLRIIEQL